MYIVDENSCVVITESTRYNDIGEYIIKQFNEELSRLYSDEDLKNGFIEITNKKGNKKKRDLLSVDIQLIG